MLTWTLVACTLVILSTGAATLAFWYYALTTRAFELDENALYVVRNLGLVGVMIGALGLFVAVGAFRRAVLPTADLLEAIDRTGLGDYNIEVQERGPREIRSLSRAYNQMLAELRRRERERRRFDQQLAQELQARVEALTSSRDLDRIDPMRLKQVARLVKDWELVARGKNGELTVESTRTDLGRLVADTLAAVHPYASARGVALRAELPNPPPVDRIDPVRVREVLERAILTALARCPAGSTIKVLLVEQRRPRALQFCVTDNGHPLEAEDLRLVFSQMGPSTDLTSGLELVAAQELITALEGEISMASDPDGGTSLTFTIPRG